jgi:hypothetical protein
VNRVSFLYDCPLSTRHPVLLHLSGLVSLGWTEADNNLGFLKIADVMEFSKIIKKPL